MGDSPLFGRLFSANLADGRLSRLKLRHGGAMNEVELIWGAGSLMFFGALVTMCMKCQRAGSKQEKASFNSQRTRCENPQTFEVESSYSVSRQEHLKIPCNMPRPSKSNEHLSSAGYLGANAEHRYQNSGKDMPGEPDAAYVKPIGTNPYYNCRKSIRVSSDEDSHSYQNVAGPSESRGCFFVDMDVYENSAEVQLWRESQISDEDSHSYQNVAGPSKSRGC